MDSVCSFSERVGISCGESRGVHRIQNLLECESDISSHLATCHLTKSNLKEYELILLRAGLFDLNTEQIDCMTVCTKHRHNLGKFWRPLKSCQYPKHSGTTRECKGRHVINPELSGDILKLYGKLVQVGSRKFPHFYFIEVHC